MTKGHYCAGITWMLNVGCSNGWSVSNRRALREIVPSCCSAVPFDAFTSAAALPIFTARRCPSVSLFVCHVSVGLLFLFLFRWPWVTPTYPTRLKISSLLLSRPSGPIILVFLSLSAGVQFQGSHSAWKQNTRGGNFLLLQFSTKIAVYLGNGTIGP